MSIRTIRWAWAQHIARAIGYVTGVVSLLLVTSLTAAGSPNNDFVKASAGRLSLHGKPFRSAGTNNYYLMYKSTFMVDDVLTTAANEGLGVVRMWGALDIGNQDDTNSIQGDGKGKADGVYFHFFAGGAPAFNDGADGLAHLDYAIYRAAQLGIKLDLTLVNNWSDFGGIDQYVRWRQGQYHDDFYTDPLIRTWFKDWIAHLLNRTNTLTGIAYKNDPTIMMWDLANEPRCKGSGVYPTSSSCTTATLVAWADDISRFIKTIDTSHLISAGDEGFYCTPGATDWVESCGEGVDTLAFTRLSAIDVMSFHLYPEPWGKDVAWGTDWIKRHFDDARKLHKPAMLGEFGIRDKTMRNPDYQQWTDAIVGEDGALALYWILAGKQDNGELYGDYDGYTVYCPGPICTTLGNFGQMLKSGRSLEFPPVADDDTATTPFGTPVTLHPATNDIAYGCTSVVPASLDLDPATAGQQTTLTVPGGTFTALPDGTVTFNPTAGFSGPVSASSSILDTRGRPSNAAALSVVVLPNPLADVLVLASFETGTEGWAPGNWQPTAGTGSQSTDFASAGTHSLRIDSVDGGWFGFQSGPPLDFTAKPVLHFELQTQAAGTSQNVAIQTGDGYIWCQQPIPGYVNGQTTTTIDVDLTHLTDCGTSLAPPNLSQIHALWVWIGAGGTFYLDNVRVQ